MPKVQPARPPGLSTLDSRYGVWESLPRPGDRPRNGHSYDPPRDGKGSIKKVNSQPVVGGSTSHKEDMDFVEMSEEAYHDDPHWVTSS